MPQIAQISATYASQIFWLLITFGLLYFVVGRGMVPRIQATVDAREARIAGDLAAAEAARAEADRVEAAWRATHAFEAQVKAADADLAERLGHHDLAIANAKVEAMANLQTVAADAARDLVAKLSGVQVGQDAAADAVRKVSAHG